MARRYDTRTTIFSPEGRLHQVEYAMEAIGQAGTCLGILANDGVLIAAERRITNKLLDNTMMAEKVYRLDDNIACSVAGITSDANILVSILRQTAQLHLMRMGSSIPVEQLVESVCNYKQAYTQLGGKRPYGVSMLFMGWDEHHGLQLYQSDPSGNFFGWKATCIGNNHVPAVALLKQEYKEVTDLKSAMSLAMRVLGKNLDVKLTADKIEMATLQRVNDKTVIKLLDTDELKTLIDDYNEKEKERAQERERQHQANVQAAIHGSRD